MPMPVELKDLAKSVLGLSYVDITELGDMLVSSVKADAEEGVNFDATDRNQWCERLRWWAEGYIDSLEG